MQLHPYRDAPGSKHFCSLAEWTCHSCYHSTWSFLISRFSRPAGLIYSVPDGGCSEHVWWHHVSPGFLYSHALYNPQEEDLVPPRPPLPQSYEPNPPTVPPMSSHAGVRPSSFHRLEDRKASHRNGTHSVSLLNHWPHGYSAVCRQVISCCDGFAFRFGGDLVFWVY